ncbi:hypothetical protein HYU92_06040 [Candidatus Curtissbacteria bacterium]|nr:hypothetical protein [Candidatus Curtissbacteria bacterium]
MKYKTILEKTVELTQERKRHIFERHPDEIRIDKLDKNVLLFYRYFSKIGNGKYLVVAIKMNERNFILTFFSTYRIKTGEKYEF